MSPNRFCFVRVQPACDSWWQRNTTDPPCDRAPTTRYVRLFFLFFFGCVFWLCFLVFRLLSVLLFSPCRPCRNDCCCNAAFCRLMGTVFFISFKKHAILRKTNQRHACSILYACLLSQAMVIAPFTGVLFAGVRSEGVCPIQLQE